MKIYYQPRKGKTTKTKATVTAVEMDGWASVDVPTTGSETDFIKAAHAAIMGEDERPLHGPLSTIYANATEPAPANETPAPVEPVALPVEPVQATPTPKGWDVAPAGGGSQPPPRRVVKPAPVPKVALPSMDRAADVSDSDLYGGGWAGFTLFYTVRTGQRRRQEFSGGEVGLALACLESEGRRHGQSNVYLCGYKTAPAFWFGLVRRWRAAAVQTVSA